MIKSTIINSTVALYSDADLSWFQTLALTQGYIGNQDGTQTFKVVQKGTPAMGVDIQAGNILVTFTKSAVTWKVLCNTTGEALTVTSNATGSNRVDAVIVKLDITVDPNTAKGNVATAQVITGTGVAPLSDGAISAILGVNFVFIRLADITVPNGAVSILDGNISNVIAKTKLTQAFDVDGSAVKYSAGALANFVTLDITSAGGYDQSQLTQNASIEVGEANVSSKKNILEASFIPTKLKIRGFALYKATDTGSFTGTVKVALQADSGGSPTGTDLASKTLSNADWLALGNGEFYALFASEYNSLVTGALYWIVVSTSTADTSNHPNLGINTAGGYANGTVKYKNTTDGHVAISTIDLYFKTLDSLKDVNVKSLPSGKISEDFFINSLTIPLGESFSGATTPQPAVIINDLAQTQISSLQYLGMTSAGQVQKVVCSITPRFNVKIGSIKLSLGKVGSPADAVQVTIQPDSSGSPSGTPIANGTTNNVAGSTLSTSNTSLKTLTWATPPTLIAGTKYWVVIERTSTESDSNYYVVSAVNNSSNVNDYASFSSKYYASNTWQTGSNNRMPYFEIIPSAGSASVSLWQSDADAVMDIMKNFDGFVITTGVAGDMATLVVDDKIDGFSGLSAYQDYYVSATKGQITTVANGQHVGRALTPNQLKITTNKVGNRLYLGSGTSGGMAINQSSQIAIKAHYNGHLVITQNSPSSVVFTTVTVSDSEDLSVNPVTFYLGITPSGGNATGSVPIRRGQYFSFVTSGGSNQAYFVPTM